MKKPIVLIIEDETAIRQMVKFALQEAAFQITEAESAQQAQAEIARQLPHLILLDWMLPGKSGIEFARQLKKSAQTKHIPIIMLTARAEEENKIKGLEIADDYITKPFSPRELIARIKTVLRRGSLLDAEGIIEIDALRLNSNTHEVHIQKQLLPLSPLEYQLLHFFMTHPERVYSREQLLNQVWGMNTDVDDRTVDVQIGRLRKILARHHYDHIIQTVRGTGYKCALQKPVIK